VMMGNSGIWSQECLKLHTGVCATDSHLTGGRFNLFDSFLISNFRRVLNVVYLLLGISPTSDCGLPTFRNTLSVPSSKPLKMELTEGSETLANHNLTPGRYPKKRTQHV